MSNNIFKKITNAAKTYIAHRRQPLHIEFNIIDHCNLNCKGCSHYSPLATPDDRQPPADLEASMRHISGIRNLDIIKDIYLIGGETLLYHTLSEAMTLARKYFPGQTLKIFTNGLLLPRMDDNFWETCRKTDTVIAITRYPIRFDYDKAIALCREQGVRTEVFGDRSLKESFFKFPLDIRKRNNPNISHFRCTSFGCVTVDRGRIFPCSQSACIGLYNRKFGTDFRHEPGDYIELSELTDARQIRQLRDRPVPFCGYCGHTQTVAYGPSKKESSEWS